MSTQALVAVADSSVRAGWIPLVIVLALGAVVAFLYFSMRKQLGKIDFDEGDGTSQTDGEVNQNGAPPSS